MHFKAVHGTVTINYSYELDLYSLNSCVFRPPPLRQDVRQLQRQNCNIANYTNPLRNILFDSPIYASADPTDRSVS